MNKYWRYLFVAVLLLVLVAIFALSHGSGTRQLEQYKATLRAQGEQLTLQELMQSRLTNHDDGKSLMALTNAVALLGSVRLYPGTLELRKFVGPGQARVIWMDPNPWSTVNAFTNDVWAEFAEELAQLEGPLDEIRKSLKDPPADGGPPSGIWGTRRVNFVAMRSAAQWLSGAAICEVHQGHLEAALEDLDALAALGRVNRDEYTLVAQMIRVAITGLGLATTWEGLQAPGWTEQQLQRLQNLWQSTDLLASVEKGLLGERAGGIQIWETLRSPNGSKRINSLFGRPSAPARSPQALLESFADDYMFTPIYKMTSVNEDELFFLTAMGESIEAVRATERGQPWPQIRKDLDQTMARVRQTSSSWRKFRHAITLVAIPNFLKAADVATRGETERQLTLAAIALKRYELRHQTLPQTLNALVPEFFSAVPHDPMRGTPLGYHQQSLHQFSLYSVGTDGIDDGGDPTPRTNKFGLWEGRDAVWPQPAPKH